MSASARIPHALRRRVLTRSNGVCAFCKSPEELMGVTFEIDHITPLAAGGKTTNANLCLCCPTCNRHKAARVAALDPTSGESSPLFHPTRDRWDDHFEWRNGVTTVFGRTSVGRATVAALQMNRSQMVLLRSYWAATGLHPGVAVKNR